MEQKYADLLLQCDKVERRIGQFNLDTSEGRKEFCEFYEKHNRRCEHPFFTNESDIQSFRDIAEEYINNGVEALLALSGGSLK